MQCSRVDIVEWSVLYCIVLYCNAIITVCVSYRIVFVFECVIVFALCCVVLCCILLC